MSREVANGPGGGPLDVTAAGETTLLSSAAALARRAPEGGTSRRRMKREGRPELGAALVAGAHMIASSLEKCRLVASTLGVTSPARHLLKKLAAVEHCYHLTAAIDRLRFPRLRSDIRFAEATELDLAEILGGIRDRDLAIRQELLARVLFYRRGFSSCHIGRSGTNELVSMQWLIRPNENALLEKHYPHLFYPLGHGQVMVENIFIFPRFRGLGVFSTVVHDVVVTARTEGFRTCSAYIPTDNVASLNGFLALGFQLHKLLTGYRLMGRSWRNL
jgi:hypothetical protein